MLFLIIFIISISAILTLYLLSNNSEKNLLHYIKESCNIDSIRFEKRANFFASFVDKKAKKMLYCIRILSLGSVKYKEKAINKTKKIIRKKLFVSKQKEQVSDYISEMKR